MEGFASFIGPSGFRGVRTRFAQSESGDVISLPADQMAILGAQAGDTIAVTPRVPARTASTGEEPSRAAGRSSLPATTASAPQGSP